MTYKIDLRRQESKMPVQEVKKEQGQKINLNKSKKSSSNRIRKMVLSSMFLAVALILPFFTGQIQQIGNALCPMHIPVLLCGFFCGPWYGLAIGLIAPLLRFLIFGMPVIYPTGIAMCLELGAYGLVSGLLYRIFPKKTIYIYVSLILAMLAGRVVNGLANAVLYGLGGMEYGWQLFLVQAFANAIPGIILQLLLIPLVILIFRRQIIE